MFTICKKRSILIPNIRYHTNYTHSDPKNNNNNEDKKILILLSVIYYWIQTKRHHQNKKSLSLKNPPENKLGIYLFFKEKSFRLSAKQILVGREVVLESNK